MSPNLLHKPRKLGDFQAHLMGKQGRGHLTGDEPGEPNRQHRLPSDQEGRAASTAGLAQRAERGVPPDHGAVLIGSKHSAPMGSKYKACEGAEDRTSPLFSQMPPTPAPLSHRGSEDQPPAHMEGTRQQSLCLRPPLVSPGQWSLCTTRTSTLPCPPCKSAGLRKSLL